jgi:hypothetical protein
MFDRQLAKWHLEQQGCLAAIDVHLGELGAVDAFGVKIGKAGGEAAVFGVVRGWWHAGAALTPSLLRHHLQTDRKLLERAFAPERLDRAAAQFGLAGNPEKVLFYSTRSRTLADAAERELAEVGIRVVYLEDVLADALARVRYEEKDTGAIFQALAMVRSSHVFKEMARRVRSAARDAAATAPEKPAAPPDPQLDFLLSLGADEDE